jgi:hypothetical protein
MALNLLKNSNLYSQTVNNIESRNPVKIVKGFSIRAHSREQNKFLNNFVDGRRSLPDMTPITQ